MASFVIVVTLLSLIVLVFVLIWQLGFMLLALIWEFDFLPFMVLIIAILNDGLCYPFMCVSCFMFSVVCAVEL